MSDEHRVVAIGLLTEHDLTMLGRNFHRAFRIEDHHDFGALLAAIDEADLHQPDPRMKMPPAR